MNLQTGFAQATKAYRQGDFSSALELAESLLEFQPDTQALPAILNLKALSLAALGLMFSADKAIRQAVDSNPDDATLRHHAARISVALGHYQVAQHQAEKACALAPGKAAYRYQLARVLLESGQLPAAKEMAEICVRQDPQLDEAWILLSEIAMLDDEADRAVDCLKSIVKSHSTHVRAWAALASLQSNKGIENAEAVEALKQVLSSYKGEGEQSTASDQATALFALADDAWRLGDHQDAFAQYEQANRCSEGLFDVSAWEQEVQSTMDQSSACLENRPIAMQGNSEEAGESLVFIVGMPRSGTSLCEQILCSHPAVYGGGELPTMEYISRELDFSGLNAYAAQPDWLETWRACYLGSLPAAAGNAVLVSDKTPRNFERLGLILRLFPAARVLWCRRHPLDVILSCFFQDFRSGQAFSHKLMDAARFYIGQERLMRHWVKYFPDSITLIEYRSLVEQLEPSVREICAFLGLDFDLAMLQPHRNLRHVRTASSDQIRKPVYTTSQGNWRHCAGQLQETISRLQQHGLLDADLNPLE